VLADYDGALLLVSHDRDFIDRLATSTIALDGRGRAVETPGGWKDFLEQNPGFFGARYAAEQSVLAPARATPRPRTCGPSVRPAKLSYKDQRRLEELERDDRRPADGQDRRLSRRPWQRPGPLHQAIPAAFDRLMQGRWTRPRGRTWRPPRRNGSSLEERREALAT
jgi:ATP-binding cassette subfamily F protein uup